MFILTYLLIESAISPALWEMTLLFNNNNDNGVASDGKGGHPGVEEAVRPAQN